jgi:hypothetical protein
MDDLQGRPDRLPGGTVVVPGPRWDYPPGTVVAKLRSPMRARLGWVVRALEAVYGPGLVIGSERADGAQWLLILIPPDAADDRRSGQVRADSCADSAQMISAGEGGEGWSGR